MKRLIGGLCAFTALMMIVFLGLGFAQSLHPAFDSFSHFRIAILVPLVAFVPVLWITNRKPIALASAIVSIITLIVTLPYLPGMKRGYALDKQTQSWNRISVLQLNMRFNNTDTQSIISALKSAPSDILLLQELTATTSLAIPAFAKSHPHQLNCFTANVGSVAILSRFPFAQDKPTSCERFEGFARATLQVGPRQISVASYHSRWPWPAGQRQQIERLTPEFNKLNTEYSILAGDFNAAPWSQAIKTIVDKTGLQVLTGLEFTWAPRLKNSRTISKHFRGPNIILR